MTYFMILRLFIECCTHRMYASKSVVLGGMTSGSSLKWGKVSQEKVGAHYPLP